MKSNAASQAIRPERGEPNDKLEGGVDHDVVSPPEHYALAQLVWKYFEEDIRTALVEVQESLAGDKTAARRKAKARKQEGK